MRTATYASWDRVPHQCRKLSRETLPGRHPFDRHRVTIMHGAHVTLVDAGENPHASQVGNRKDLRGARLDTCPGETSLSTASPSMGQAPELPALCVLRQAIGMFDSDDFQSLFCGLQSA